MSISHSISSQKALLLVEIGVRTSSLASFKYALKEKHSVGVVSGLFEHTVGE
jgi:hypothetical protein